MNLKALLTEARACDVCAEHLPLGPRPILRAQKKARLLIIGQAPGTKVHASGIPWNDPSGDRLRDWLAVSEGEFYDESKVAIMPMGFCYPGRLARGGDAPPRPECAPLWHDRVRAHLPNIGLTLLVGSYAQAYYLADRRSATMGETVKNWRAFTPDLFPTPHPSWRTMAWQKKNDWFEVELLPELRARVRELLN